MSSHRRARRAQWLRQSNAELAAWLQASMPAVKVLAEVPEDADPWPAEKDWIVRLAHPGLLNRRGNPAWRPKRCGGPESAAAA